MDDLVQFLRARLDEDYAAVQLVLGVNVMAAIRDGKSAPRWIPSPKSESGVWDTDGQPRVKFVWARERDHIIRHDPARILVEVEAKQKIVGIYEDAAVGQRAATGTVGVAELMDGSANSLRFALRLLALPYADHPDYQREWKP